MRSLILPLLLVFISCSTPEEAVAVLEDGQAVEMSTVVFGYRGGWGSEQYVRYHDGVLYRNSYAGLRTNEAGNKLNRDALATDAANWTPVGPAPANVLAAVRELPLTALLGIEERVACPALAYDGGCPYLGVVRADDAGGDYVEWHGDFPDAPTVAAYMRRVGDLVRTYVE